MNHASLFSGIGGPEVAAEMMGWNNVFHCEINPFGRAVLEYWYPNSHSYEDITKTNFKQYRGQIDILTGGFPCQPFSYAGKRGGQGDDRYLWPEMLRAINEIRPTWVIGENVAGITTMVESGQITDLGGETTLFQEGADIHEYNAEYTFTIERICKDLEELGYSVQPVLIPAAAVGAPHRRDRVFIIAHTDIGDDLREAGEYEETSAEERVSKRNAVRKSGESSDVRSESQKFIEATLCNGCVCGDKEEQRCEWNIRNTCTRDNEWLCGKEGVESSSDTNRDGRGEIHKYIQSELADGEKLISNGWIRNASGSESQSSERCRADCEACSTKQEQHRGISSEGVARMLPGERWKRFPIVSPIHRGNDGLPFDVDNLTIPFSKWRAESLKAYGNAIVPQVMYRIFQAIESISQ